MNDEKKIEAAAVVQKFDSADSNKRNYKTPIEPMEFDKIKKGINPVIFDVPTKSFEDKKYIVLIKQDSNDELFDGEYKICDGRTKCFRYIHTLFEAFGDEINAHESIVITETKQVEAETGNSKYYLLNLEDSVSIYSFCKSVEEYYRGSVYEFFIDDIVSPPEDVDISINEEKLNDEAFLYASSIDDPIIAQAAMDTFKEKARMMHESKSKSINNSSKNTSEEDTISPYASLFEDDGNSRNV